MSSAAQVIFNALPVITSMGRSIFDPIWAIEAHTDPNTELIHVLHGTVKIQTPRYTIAGKAGDTLYIPSGIRHRDVFPLDSAFEVYLVQFRWADEAKMLRRFTPTQLAQLNEKAKARLATECRLLYQDFLAGDGLSRQMTSLRLLQIVCAMCRDASGAGKRSAGGRRSTDARRTEILQTAKRIIHERYAQHLSLNTIADAMKISPYYLSHIFSEQSGFTLSSYLTSVRMEKAADLLKRTSDTVADIAAAVGYNDAHYFGKVFRAHYGKTPSQFRSRKTR